MSENVELPALLDLNFKILFMVIGAYYESDPDTSTENQKMGELECLYSQSFLEGNYISGELLQFYNVGGVQRFSNSDMYMYIYEVSFIIIHSLLSVCILVLFL